MRLVGMKGKRKVGNQKLIAGIVGTVVVVDGIVVAEAVEPDAAGAVVGTAWQLVKVDGIVAEARELE
jgi:hypothetical protein